MTKRMAIALALVAGTATAQRQPPATSPAPDAAEVRLHQDWAC